MNSLQVAIANIVQEQLGQQVDVVLTRPDPQFGDFATNIALQLAKQVGKNPREIADMLAASLKETLQDSVTDVTVAGPGFINITLTDSALLAEIDSVADIPQIMAGKEVVAEYSDPNPFKELHAGHLYTTLVGDAIARLVQGAGANVHRINYGGDVGLHVGKAMWAILKHLGGELPERLTDVPEFDRPSWISARYVEGSAAYEEDEAAKAEIVAVNKRVYELHAAGDKESAFAQIYWTCRDWSYAGFDRLYQSLEVTPFERYLPESETTPAGLDIANQALARGIFEESDGAVVFRGEDHGLHTRVFINSAGLPTYEAKDLGLAATKWRDYKFDHNFIITGNDIVEYMKVILKVLDDFYPEVAQRTTHLTHGMIKLPGAIKMSSRKGNVLRAHDILDEAGRAAASIADNVSHQTILAAVKYAFLKNRVGGDIIYDPQESVSIEGNSGPYLQYAHARARSITRKGTVANAMPVALEAGERQLVSKLNEFSEVAQKAVEELAPHLVCTYLYELAQTFNRFYEHNRVVGDPREAERLYLIDRYAAVLKQGLDLLGIHAPEEM